MARSSRYLVVCLKNDGYDVSLEKRKIYIAIPDVSAAKHGLVRVLDESGDDYLYPGDYFVSLELPTSVRRAVLAAA
ncbi:MAG TPA: hypothetical protein VEN78_29870 [Bradyrhizobium sp.]|nr:hypothetical protein [Bradyrhizobium sp.]